MSGADFAKICRQLWGKDWKKPAAERLHRSERQLLNIQVGKSKLKSHLRRKLLEIVREQIAVLQAFDENTST